MIMFFLTWLLRQLIQVLLCWPHTRPSTSIPELFLHNHWIFSVLEAGLSFFLIPGVFDAECLCTVILLFLRCILHLMSRKNKRWRKFAEHEAEPLNLWKPSGSFVPVKSRRTPFWSETLQPNRRNARPIFAMLASVFKCLSQPCIKVSWLSASSLWPHIHGSAAGPDYLFWWLFWGFLVLGVL